MTSPSKVVIPWEVADALDAARAAGVSNATIIDVRNDEFNAGVIGLTSAALRFIPFDTLLQALVTGYERELTDEESRHKAIVDEYEEYVHGVLQLDTEGEDYAYAEGIVFALNTLGIVIPGVNAPKEERTHA